MLKLPDVTLLIVETREHDLMRLAIDDCLKTVQFGDVLILSDRPFHCSNARFVEVVDYPDKLSWQRGMWYDPTPHLRTSHALSVEWDAGIVDASMWRDEFLQYDYTGSPWWYKDFKNVGNGGFSLMSTRLRRYLYSHSVQFPCVNTVGDDLLCRKYRPDLETVGFRWAPEKLAHDFAFECCRPSPASRHFGFHGIFNWGDVYSEDKLLTRMRIALRSPYISNPKNHFLGAFEARNPAIMKKLLAEQSHSLVNLPQQKG